MMQCAPARAMAILIALLLVAPGAPRSTFGYALNRTVADKRNAANIGLGACPQLNRMDTLTAGKFIDRRWSTVLGANIQTTATVPATRVNEVELSIVAAFNAWTSVAGATLRGTSLDPLLVRTSTTSACSSSDGMNSICFAQSSAFPPGVLAFTNTVMSDILGERFPVTAPPSAFIGEILDADVLFNPAVAFSTPSALASSPPAFDLETVLIHELGHFFGFSHSGVWGAMMYPFAPPLGQFFGSRATGAVPDAPLSEDDRTGLRVLYPDPSDTLRVGSISGRIVPANPLSLAGQPTGVTGIFGAQVVAMDEATGAVIGSALAGWSCSGQGPAVFDGGYAIERLLVGRSYRVYVEPLDGPVGQSNMAGAMQSLCRNSITDPGWPAQYACTVPAVNTNFSTRARGQ